MDKVGAQVMRMKNDVVHIDIHLKGTIRLRWNGDVKDLERSLTSSSSVTYLIGKLGFWLDESTELGIQVQCKNVEPETIGCAGCGHVFTKQEIADKSYGKVDWVIDKMVKTGKCQKCQYIRPDWEMEEDTYE